MIVLWFLKKCLEEIDIPALESFAVARQDCQKYTDQVPRQLCPLPLQGPKIFFFIQIKQRNK